MEEMNLTDSGSDRLYDHHDESTGLCFATLVLRGVHHRWKRRPWTFRGSALERSRGRSEETATRMEFGYASWRLQPDRQDQLSVGRFREESIGGSRSDTRRDAKYRGGSGSNEL